MASTLVSPTRVVRKKKNSHTWTRDEMQFMLNKMVLLILDGIINYKEIGRPIKTGFTIDQIHKVTDVERETPLDFQHRFFLLMDILEPSKDYARSFIKVKHPDALYLFDWLVELYVGEAKLGSSHINEHNIRD